MKTRRKKKKAPEPGTFVKKRKDPESGTLAGTVQLSNKACPQYYVELEDGTRRTYIGCCLRKIEENADRRGGRYGSLFIETVILELSPEMFEDR